MPKILLADDDVELCELLADYLSGEGFEVDAVHDGTRASERIADETLDVLVLDVMMPGKNGFDVLRSARAQSELPIIMLTARGEDLDRIVGLEIGADDYLVKPCNPRELAARIRAVLRRVGRASAGSPAAEPLVVEDLKLNPGQRTLEVGGIACELTSTEFSVLEVLMREAGQVVTKETLTERALGRKLALYDRSIDMHVSNLRRKLGPGPRQNSRIKTVRSVGYLLVN